MTETAGDLCRDIDSLRLRILDLPPSPDRERAAELLDRAAAVVYRLHERNVDLMIEAKGKQ